MLLDRLAKEHCKLVTFFCEVFHRTRPRTVSWIITGPLTSELTVWQLLGCRQLEASFLFFHVHYHGDELYRMKHADNLVTFMYFGPADFYVICVIYCDNVSYLLSQVAGVFSFTQAVFQGKP